MTGSRVAIAAGVLLAAGLAVFLLTRDEPVAVEPDPTPTPAIEEVVEGSQARARDYFFEHRQDLSDQTLLLMAHLARHYRVQPPIDPALLLESSPSTEGSDYARLMGRLLDPGHRIERALVDERPMGVDRLLLESLYCDAFGTDSEALLSIFENISKVPRDNADFVSQFYLAYHLADQNGCIVPTDPGWEGMFFTLRQRHEELAAEDLDNYDLYKLHAFARLAGISVDTDSAVLREVAGRQAASGGWTRTQNALPGHVHEHDRSSLLGWLLMVQEQAAGESPGD